MAAEALDEGSGRPPVRLHDFTVVDNERVAEGIRLMHVRSDALARSLEPGQFINVAVPGDPSQILRIPVSFSGFEPEEGLVEIAYAVVGDGTRRMSEMTPGTASTAVGPCGNGWGEVEGRALLVAGGIGSAPVVCEARHLGSLGIEFDAVLGAQTSARLWGVGELSHAGAGELLVTTDDGSAGIAGFATVAVERLLAGGAYRQVLCCGPQPLMAGVARLAERAGTPCRASLERMMTCGFGACNTCNVALVGGGYASCCTDGPVFDASEVIL